MELVIPGYEIIKEIAQGGMSTVYMAIQKNFERRVALKVMAPRLTSDPQFGERFLREARLVSRLNHRNIVPVFDVGRYGDFHYLAMEYLPGGDLKSRMRAGMSPEDALYAVYEIANALAYAHAKSIIHRDIKPENVLFREDATLVLTDFGIAKAADEIDGSLTSTGLIVGSPHYMSPEQALAQSVDYRSDIYSLGVVLYEALVGCPLYDAKLSVATAIRHVSDPIPHLPPRFAALQPILEKMVAKRPEDRFQSMAEVELVLEPLLGTPVEEWARLPLSSVAAAPANVVPLMRPAVVSRSGFFAVPRRDTPAPRFDPSAPTLIASALEFNAAVAREVAAPPKPLAPVVSLAPDNVVAPEHVVGPAPPLPQSRRRSGFIRNFLVSAMVLMGLSWLSVAGVGRLVAPLPPDEGLAEQEPARLVPPAPADGAKIGDALAGQFLVAALDPKAVMGAPTVPPTLAPQPDAAPAQEESQAPPPAPKELTPAERLQARINALLAQARVNLRRDRLTLPKGNSAFDDYLRVLALAPGHAEAMAGLEAIVRRYRSLARQRLDQGELALAQTYVERGEAVLNQFALSNEERVGLAHLREALTEQRHQQNLAQKQRILEQKRQALAQARTQAELERWNQRLADTSSLTVDDLNKAYRFYMSMLEKQVQGAQLDEIRERFSAAFYTLGRHYFRQNQMDLSGQLIAKGLEINPHHAELLALDARWQRRRDGKESLFDRLWR